MLFSVMSQCSSAYQYVSIPVEFLAVMISLLYSNFLACRNATDLRSDRTDLRTEKVDIVVISSQTDEVDELFPFNGTLDL